MPAPVGRSGQFLSPMRLAGIEEERECRERDALHFPGGRLVFFGAGPGQFRRPQGKQLLALRVSEVRAGMPICAVRGKAGPYTSSA
ncbi:hypothetical protein [Streptomyces sp. NPDC002994]|uniref:hypothetical protein n=1 Tax=Streptomyces sp. NPDC002994 TaxID=3154441 RepID=UPI0033A488E0